MFVLQVQISVLLRCFDKETVEGILAALEADGSDWARKQIEVGGCGCSRYTVKISG